MSSENTFSDQQSIHIQMYGHEANKRDSY